MKELVPGKLYRLKGVVVQFDDTGGWKSSSRAGIGEVVMYVSTSFRKKRIPDNVVITLLRGKDLICPDFNVRNIPFWFEELK